MQGGVNFTTGPNNMNAHAQQECTFPDPSPDPSPGEGSGNETAEARLVLTKRFY